MAGGAAFVLHSLRGFPNTDIAAHLPLSLSVAGRLRADIPGRFWYCQVDPPATCRLDPGAERSHIVEELLSEDGTRLRIEAVVVTPAASNQVLQTGVMGLAVHVAAVLDPVIGATGVLDVTKTGYLGSALVDDSSVRGASRVL